MNEWLSIHEEQILPKYAEDALQGIENTPRNWRQSAYDYVFWKEKPSPSERKTRKERDFAVIENIWETQDTIRVSSYGRTSTFTIKKSTSDTQDLKIDFSFWKDETVQLWVSKENYASDSDNVKKDMVILWNLLNFISYNQSKPQNEWKKHWTLTAPTGYMGYGWAERLVLAEDDWSNSRLTEIGITEIIRLSNWVLDTGVWFYLEKNDRKSTHMWEIVKRIFMEE